MRLSHKIFVIAALLVFLVACSAHQPSTQAELNQEQVRAQQLVDRAQMTFNNFMADPNMRAMRNMMKDAKGVFIMPQELKAAFIVGASGGNGVLVKRTGNTNDWTGPAFYTVGGASFGLQAGAQAAEIVLLIMSDRGIASFLSNSFKLGVDAGVAVGPMGVGAAASTANLSADIVSFAKSKGLYGGVSLDGAVVAPRGSLNTAYYGKPEIPTDILIKGIKAPQASGLLRAVSVATRESAQPKAKEEPRVQ